LSDGIPPPKNWLSGRSYRTSPGARKEQLRQRAWRPPASAASPRPYVELHAASAFSFLDGASQPEDLVERAAELGVGALAVADTNGVYGAPRVHAAARGAGLRAIVGAEMALDPEPSTPRSHLLPVQPGPCEAAPPKHEGHSSEPRADHLPRLTLLVRSPEGYRNLCRLLTAAARGRPKGTARATWGLIAQHAEGLHCLTGGDEGPLAHALRHGGLDSARGVLERLAGTFRNRLHVELQRHRLRASEHRNRALVDLARHLRLPVVATNGVRFATSRDRELYDVLCCIREGTSLEGAGARLHANRERRLKSPAEMAELFADLPGALDATVELADELQLTLANLGYRFPDFPLPPGETPASYLRQITWNGARTRFRPLTARAQDQISRELDLIEKLDLAGYFLIVWDIVRFCQERGILAQGRGSAANSAVCYALSITAVDPVKMELLFERFLSEERGEWPDIDLDLPSGHQRESVIQYVYDRYGPHGAAMTANVITYRERSAAREVGKALGLSLQQVDRLARAIGRHAVAEIRAGTRTLEAQIGEAGLDPASRQMQRFADLWWRIQNLPRHLGQHSGGMVMAAGRLDEVVPLEPASMPGRTVIQWDKDDCADLGIIKVDLLGLGMLDAIEQMVPMIRTHEGVHVDLAHLPPDDPKVYEMLQRADTVGLFQVESRAQMASLPRNRPERFYDLVVQVAIIRPGPITGNMTNPYLERRRGRQKVTYPHPSLEPILKRTLGVPLFQEQLLRMAMVAAGFTGGEAEELRRAMGFKRSVDKMQAIEQRLRDGMARRGITGDVQDQVVQAITSFALYGFPESHAASFALIVYASAYLKAHHPTAFYTGLLNAWPMGFYHPSTLIQDAVRRGVEVRPVDVQCSGWRCRWEDGAVRLGLRYVKGLRTAAGERIEAEQARSRFHDSRDLTRRCRLSDDELDRLAHAGALTSFGLTRRAAQWQVAQVARTRGSLLDQLPVDDAASLPEMDDWETSAADYQTTGVTTGPHLVAHLREALDRHGIVPANALADRADGERVRHGGAVIVRQRPGTAKGFVFLTLEDETGMVQAILRPDLFQRERRTVVGSPLLMVEGTLQKRGGTISIKADRLWPLPTVAAPPSHDFH
jgi:error-prone DNA polymerase